MTELVFQDVLDSTGAELVRGAADRRLCGVSTDTRTLAEGDLFLALSGPNFDGNRFAVDAARRGASCMLLARDTAPALEDMLEDLIDDVAVALVDDPRRALADLAAWHRRRLDASVLGLTGSCGKTSTKNIVLELLRDSRRVAGSPASFNNDVGVPHTLLLADESTDVLVVEMGTNGPGEIAELCRIARPDCGIVTNVGAAHLEGLGSVEGVAREKGALAAAIPADGFVVLNADCRWTPVLRDMACAPVTTFSVDGAGDLDARDVWFHAGGTTFTLRGNAVHGEREVTLPLLGLHTVQNLLAGLAACLGLGLELDDVLPAVARLRDGRRRMERLEIGGLTLFDDSYNANPASARASVRVLCGLHGHARRVFVLGDMLELGAFSAEEHHSLGRVVGQSGIDLFVLVGELTRACADGALEGGMPAGSVVHVDTVGEALSTVPALLRDGDVVLVKGSRATGLDGLVNHLLGALSAEARAPLARSEVRGG